MNAGSLRATEIPPADQANAGLPRIWDMTLPGMFSGLNEVQTLFQFHALGYRFVSVTAANDACLEPAVAAHAIQSIHRTAEANEGKFAIVTRASEIEGAVAADKLAISFNFQGTNPFGGNIDNVARFAELGLDHALLAYNEANSVGGGCASDPGDPLTAYGRDLIGEFNRRGVIVDGSHAGYRTTMQAMDISQQPFIFSHSNAHGLFPHYRNVRDDQIRACASSGGVVGINGVGAFLNADGVAGPEQIFRHIDYVAELVGHEHVGLALDFIERADLFAQRAADETWAWPENNGQPVRFDQFAEPEVMHEVVALLESRGYAAGQIDDILWGNFYRVYAEVVG